MTTTATTNEVALSDIGPIEKLRLPVKPGAITVLTGPNGVGKSIVLDSIDQLSGGKGRLSSRDGTTGGKAKGFGVQITVGRGGANRRTVVDEDLVVESIEDRVQLSDLIDPGIKDVHAADARRIRALVTLAGIDPSPELFYPVTDGDEAMFNSVVSVDSLTKPDLVEMAAAVKRDFEKAARDEAKAAERLESEVLARRESNAGIDLDAESDQAVLQAELEGALYASAELKQKRASALETLHRADEARAKLQAEQSRYDGPTVAEATQRLETGKALVTEAQDRVEHLRKALEAAEAAEREAIATRDNAIAQLTAAQSHDRAIEGWRETIDAAEGVDCPTEDDIESSESDVKAAREANEQGVRVRDAQKRAAEAEKLNAEAKEFAGRAESYRSSAKATEDVLSRIVAAMGGTFKVDKEFRLVVEHPVRGFCYFAELSAGEKTRLALDAVIASVKQSGEPRLLALRQELYESLDGKNRHAIAEQIRGTDLSIITAEASRNEDAKAEIVAEVV